MVAGAEPELSFIIPSSLAPSSDEDEFAQQGSRHESTRVRHRRSFGKSPRIDADSSTIGRENSIGSISSPAVPSEGVANVKPNVRLMRVNSSSDTRGLDVDGFAPVLVSMLASTRDDLLSSLAPMVDQAMQRTADSCHSTINLAVAPIQESLHQLGFDIERMQPFIAERQSHDASAASRNAFTKEQHVTTASGSDIVTSLASSLVAVPSVPLAVEEGERFRTIQDSEASKLMILQADDRGIAHGGDDDDDAIWRLPTNLSPSLSVLFEMENDSESRSLKGPTQSTASDWLGLEALVAANGVATATQAGALHRLRRQLNVPEPSRRNLLARAVQSRPFERCVALVILINVLYMGYAAEYAVLNPFHSSTPHMELIEAFFWTFYAMELALKLALHRCFFFTNEDWRWNILDLLLVGISSFDMVAIMAAQQQDDSGDAHEASSKGYNVTFLRCLRLVRLSRIIRAFRVMKLFQPLHVMLQCIASTLQNLFWCGIMLTIFWYIFAVIFLYGVSGLLADPEGDTERFTGDTSAYYDYELLMEYWGSLPKAMASLYQATTGGRDWADLADVLWPTGRIYYVIFLFYIMFVMMGVLNILTGIFVESAIHITSACSRSDFDQKVSELVKADQEAALQFGRIYRVIAGVSPDAVGEICEVTVEQFVFQMRTPALRAHFAALGLEIWDVKHFLDLITGHAGATISMHIFVRGCMMLRGQAKNIAIQSLGCSVEKLSRAFKELRDGKACGAASRCGRCGANKTGEKGSEQATIDTANTASPQLPQPLRTHPSTPMRGFNVSPGTINADRSVSPSDRSV